MDDGPSFAPYDPNRASHERVRQRFRDLRTSGDQSIRDELILEHRWIAEQCSRRFRHRGEPDADLIQIAWLGLLKSVDRYDPEYKISFPKGTREYYEMNNWLFFMNAGVGPMQGQASRCNRFICIEEDESVCTGRGW